MTVFDGSFNLSKSQFLFHIKNDAKIRVFLCAINRPWQSQPTKKGKGVVTKINFSIGVMFYGPKEAQNTVR